MDPKNNDYRVGWPVLAPLPVKTIKFRGLSDLISNLTDIMDRVQTILETRRIDSEEPLFALRLPKHMQSDDPEADEYLTLVVPTDMIHDGSKAKEAVVELRAALKKKEFHIRIELIHHAVVKDRITFPISPFAHYVRSKWDTLADSVIGVLSPSDWIGVELLHRGIVPDINYCPPTVVVTSPTITAE